MLWQVLFVLCWFLQCDQSIDLFDHMPLSQSRWDSLSKHQQALKRHLAKKQLKSVAHLFLLPLTQLPTALLSCHKPDTECQAVFLPCNAHFFSLFKHTHIKELVFTRDFIFGRNFPAWFKREVGINYSASVGSLYPKSILGVCCAQQPLKEMKEISIFLYFCVFRECWPRMYKSALVFHSYTELLCFAG